MFRDVLQCIHVSRRSLDWLTGQTKISRYSFLLAFRKEGETIITSSPPVLEKEDLSMAPQGRAAEKKETGSGSGIGALEEAEVIGETAFSR